MKTKIITVTMTILMSITMIAQQKQEAPQSKAETFSQKSGTLIQKEFERIGAISKCQFSVVTYTDLISQEKEKAVRIEFEYVGKYNTDTKIALLDADELDGFIKSLKLIIETISKTTPTNYTEVAFKSRGGFEAGAFYEKEKWFYYMKLEKYDSDSYVFLQEADIKAMLATLELCKTKL
jgi:hypothetical protein